VFLYAFDLLDLDGKDLRREPLERHKVLLIRLLAKAPVGLQVNDHIRSVSPCGEAGSRGVCSETNGPATPASLASKASCRSGSARAMSPDVHGTGSRARTPTHPL
jgi:hypothetical protein